MQAMRADRGRGGGGREAKGWNEGDSHIRYASGMEQKTSVGSKATKPKGEKQGQQPHLYCRTRAGQTKPTKDQKNRAGQNRANRVARRVWAGQAAKGKGTTSCKNRAARKADGKGAYWPNAAGEGGQSQGKRKETRTHGCPNNKCLLAAATVSGWIERQSKLLGWGVKNRARSSSIQIPHVTGRGPGLSL
ncbi:unnamed protein product [Natator depressus]